MSLNVASVDHTVLVVFSSLASAPNDAVMSAIVFPLYFVCQTTPIFDPLMRLANLDPSGTAYVIVLGVKTTCFSPSIVADFKSPAVYNKSPCHTPGMPKDGKYLNAALSLELGPEGWFLSMSALV